MNEAKQRILQVIQEYNMETIIQPSEAQSKNKQLTSGNLLN
jgi:hypothetical protein